VRNDEKNRAGKGEMIRKVKRKGKGKKGRREGSMAEEKGEGRAKRIINRGKLRQKGLEERKRNRKKKVEGNG
jgi:hypothetical protein